MAKAVNLSGVLASFRMRTFLSNGGEQPAAVTRIITALNALSDDELVSTIDLTVLVKLGLRSIQQHANHPALADHRFKLKPKLAVWGSRKAIKHLRKQMQETV